MSVIIGTNNLDDWGIVTKRTIGSPKVRKKSITVPGRNGEIDCSDILLGYPTYDNRTIKISLVIYPTTAKTLWQVKDEVFAALHGKKLNVYMEEGYHYEGRISVSYTSTVPTYGEVEIECDCLPFAMKDTKTVKQIATGSITLSSSMPTEIVIKATSTVRGSYEGQSFEYSTGEHTIISPKLFGSKTITITSGTGTIEYIEGKL